MSNYAPWWDTTITVFNKYEDPQTHVITWYRKVVTQAFWKYVNDTVSVGGTVLEAKKIVCRIRESSAFLEKYLWLKQTNDSRANFFTLGSGDIIVKGEVSDVIDEYTAGKRSSDILSKYRALQGCMEIDTVAINIGAGRCEPHYRAEGN